MAAVAWSVTTWASPGPRPADSERLLGPRLRGKEDNKSLENNAGSGSRARPALGINICYVESLDCHGGSKVWHLMRGPWPPGRRVNMFDISYDIIV